MNKRFLAKDSAGQDSALQCSHVSIVHEYRHRRYIDDFSLHEVNNGIKLIALSGAVEYCISLIDFVGVVSSSARLKGNSATYWKRHADERFNSRSLIASDVVCIFQESQVQEIRKSERAAALMSLSERRAQVDLFVAHM
jgi:hypothetical protein